MKISQQGQQGFLPAVTFGHPPNRLGLNLKTYPYSRISPSQRKSLTLFGLFFYVIFFQTKLVKSRRQLT